MLLFVLWMAWRPRGEPATGYLLLRLSLFFAFYGLLIFSLAVWARLLAGQVVTETLHRSVHRFNRMVDFSRWLIPVWFGVGVYLMGWGDFMHLIFPPMQDGEPVNWMGLHLPTLFIGILPGLLTWMGLWWAQFPADRALREQSLLNQLDHDLPIIAPPRFRDYFASNFRMQILFICMPLLLIVGMRDLMTQSWLWAGQTMSEAAELGIFIASVVLIFTIAPLVLTRVLRTESLPPSSLRRRLEAMCRRAGLRYRDILLWNTNHNVVNAGVMGLFPQVRYILLSDALLETMSDDQIEAVFAHELGHVVHRHMVWYAIFFIIFFFCGLNVGHLLKGMYIYSDELMAMGWFGVFFLSFGVISRQCERQADVYAARLMEIAHRQSSGDTSDLVLTPADLVAPLSPAIAGASVELAMSGESATSAHVLPVGRHGAAIFSSALHRVATVNNIPVKKHEWLHGSIQSRLDFIRDMAGHPKSTQRFDRQMQLMNGLLLVALFMSLLWFASVWAQETSARHRANPARAGEVTRQPQAGVSARSDLHAAGG